MEINEKNNTSFDLKNSKQILKLYRWVIDKIPLERFSEHLQNNGIRNPLLDKNKRFVLLLFKHSLQKSITMNERVQRWIVHLDIYIHMWERFTK